MVMECLGVRKELKISVMNVLNKIIIIFIIPIFQIAFKRLKENVVKMDLYMIQV